MAKNNKPTTLHKKLVIKLLPDMILASISSNNKGILSETEVIRWKLPKKINPNEINQDLELLTSSINNMVSHYGLEGETVTFILPHRVSPTRIIEIPMNLEIKAEKKEFSALTKTNTFDFWKEHDPNLATIKQAEIRSHFLMALPEDNASKLLYTTVRSKDLKDYITLLLGANLYPTSFVSEDQILIRIVESKLFRVERERPFCIFHLCKSNSRLIHVTPESMNMATIDIDELDELLLDDLPSTFEETNNDFWKEVIGRLNTALKQGVYFLNEEIKVPKFDSIYFCTDYKQETVLFELFRHHFRLANFQSLAGQFSIIDFKNSNEGKEKITQNNNDSMEEQYGTQFIAHAGCYPIQYSSTPSIQNPLINAPLFNLHPGHDFIETNFLKESWVKSALKVAAALIAVLIGLNLIMAVTNGLTDDKTETQKLSIEKTLESLKSQNKALENDSVVKKNILKQLTKMVSGQENEHLLIFLSHHLPIDTELDSVLIYEQTFTLQGTAKTMTSVNMLYEELNLQEKISGLKLDTYKKKGADNYFFEVSGALEGEVWAQIIKNCSSYHPEQNSF